MAGPERLTRQFQQDLDPRQTAPAGAAVRPTPATASMLWLQNTAGNRAVASQLSVQRSLAEDLIDEHTSWYGNLAEDELGQELLRRAMGGAHQLVQATLDELAWHNRDDVSLEFAQAATGAQLAELAASESGRRLLDRMYDELTEGSMAADEQEQAERILRVKSERVDQAQAQQQMTQGKVFPLRASGITVLDDSPIMAERREGGQIWVKLPVRVLGTEMFQAETATLPHDVFIGGALLPENEVVGVKFYDLGGEVVYRPALFLVQVSNQNDTATLAKIAEVAGIGLTLGTGALVSLGVEASMTARVLLWADRAAFLLGTITTVINEHRGEIIERFGEDGRRFLHYVDIVHSATAMYGFARMAIGMAQLVNGLRGAYVNWRSAARSLDSELSSGEQQVVQQISDQTDDMLKNADDIAGSTQQPPAATTSEPTEPTVAPPERQLGPGRPPTARERLDARRAEQAEQARATEVREGIERVDRELAAGTHRRRISQDDLDWLNANPVTRRSPTIPTSAPTGCPRRGRRSRPRRPACFPGR
ncbi:hypothetical protein GCM10029964_097260 [Kibdelosporangium lantanae]